MDMHGDLESIDLSTLLEILYKGMKTGVLTIRRGDETKKVLFRNGAIIYATSQDNEYKLGEILVQKKMADKEDISKALEAQADSDMKFGEILLQQKLVSEKDLEKALKLQGENELFNLFLWKSGHYEFEEKDISQEQSVTLPESMVKLIKEGAKSLDLLQKIRATIGSTETVLKPVPNIKQMLKEISLTGFQWQVLSVIDGKKSMSQVAQELDLPLVETYKCAVDLLNMGLLIRDSSELGVHYNAFNNALKLSLLINAYNYIFSRGYGILKRSATTQAKALAANILKQGAEKYPGIYSEISIDEYGFLDLESLYANIFNTLKAKDHNYISEALNYLLINLITTIRDNLGDDETERQLKEFDSLIHEMAEQSKQVVDIFSQRLSDITSKIRSIPSNLQIARQAIHEGDVNKAKNALAAVPDNNPDFDEAKRLLKQIEADKGTSLETEQEVEEFSGNSDDDLFDVLDFPETPEDDDGYKEEEPSETGETEHASDRVDELDELFGDMIEEEGEKEEEENQVVDKEEAKPEDDDSESFEEAILAELEASISKQDADDDASAREVQPEDEVQQQQKEIEKEIIGEQESDDDKLDEFFEEESELEIDPATILFNKGITLFRKKDFMGAKRIFDEIVQRFPKHDEAKKYSDMANERAMSQLLSGIDAQNVRPRTIKTDFKNIKITPQEGYLLSQLDGNTTLKEAAHRVGIKMESLMASLLKFFINDIVEIPGLRKPEPQPEPSGNVQQDEGSHVGAKEVQDELPDFDDFDEEAISTDISGEYSSQDISSADLDNAAEKKNTGSKSAEFNIQKLDEQDDDQQGYLREDDLDSIEKAEIKIQERKIRAKVYLALNKAKNQDLYSFLGVKKGASPEIVKKAYLIKTKICNPDVYKGLLDKELIAKCKELFKKYTEAYETLSDEKKRREYDRDKRAQRSEELEKKKEAAMYFQKGMQAFDEQDFERATQYFREAVKLFPINPVYHAKLEEIRRIDKSKRGIIRYKTGLMEFEQKNYEEAIKHLKSAFEINPTKHEWLLKLLEAYKKVPKLKDESLEYYEKWIEMEPTNPKVYLEYGRALKSVGKKKEAGEQFFMALKWDPRNKEAKEALGELKKEGIDIVAEKEKEKREAERLKKNREKEREKEKKKKRQ